MLEKQQQWEDSVQETICLACQQIEQTEKKEIEANRLNQLLAPGYVSCDYKAQSITLAFDVKEWQWNPRGELHGGAIAAMFDLALGLAARCASGADQIATTDMSISYLRRVDGDDTVLTEITVRKRGSQMIRLSGEARSKKTGKPVAMVQSSYMILA